MNRLTGLLPPFAQEYREFKIIHEAIIPELDQIKEEQNEIKDAQFIMTCPLKYIHLWEETLGIKDGEQNDLETRRINCLFKKCDTLPYNRKKINDRIYTIVPKEYCNILWGKNYINVGVAGQFLRLIKVINEMLDNVLPLNMIISVSGFIEIESSTTSYYGGASSVSTVYSAYTTY